MSNKLEAWADNIVTDVLEGDMSLNEGIEKLESKMQGYEILKSRRDRLTSARRALLGAGNKLTSGGGNRVTQEEVYLALKEFEEGATVAQLVEAVPGSNDGQIRGHLNRGKGGRFLLDNGVWTVNP